MPLRLLPFALVVLLFAWTLWIGSWLLALPLAVLLALGIIDLQQAHSAVRRNYPLIGRVRFLAEDLRPFVRQYFVEDDNQEVPFSYAQRTLVYQRSKGVLDKLPFGTERDLYAAKHEWINHSLAPTTPDLENFRVSVGGERCRHPAGLSTGT